MHEKVRYNVLCENMVHWRGLEARSPALKADVITTTSYRRTHNDSVRNSTAYFAVFFFMLINIYIKAFFLALFSL